ncbi:hypothetical protein BV898_02581 [Hypsibius exemplaris]|uniref:C2H2-type domain-containing protein n=1 Tax=Hypsibius exemplaris TaxID=2072580 RepID=A0A1W0X865_HYPEX|nr:hypothetical protein BV898_02581 [Hypsibius exemplaris]
MAFSAFSLSSISTLDLHWETFKDDYRLNCAIVFYEQLSGIFEIFSVYCCSWWSERSKMGKRKQECPRKLAEPGSELSKLENIVKKLKTHAPTSIVRSTPPLPEPESLPVALVAASTPANSTQPLSLLRNNADSPTKQLTSYLPEAPAPAQPLDLRLPRIPIINKNEYRSQQQQVLTPTCPSPTSHAAALDLSRSSTTTIQTLSPLQQQRLTPMLSTPPVQSTTYVSTGPADKRPSTATSFQELSDKLEQYFSTGIAASKFPRKMVRGQDMWMQDVEQKRRILKCLKCGSSYNTLAELAKHIKKTGHHTTEVPALSMGHHHSSGSQFRRADKVSPAISTSKTDHSTIGKSHGHISRGPSAFRPVPRSTADRDPRGGVFEPQKGFPNFSAQTNGHGRHPERIRDVISRHINLQDSPSRQPSSVSSVIRSAGSGSLAPVGHNGFFHGIAVLPAEVVRRPSLHRSFRGDEESGKHSSLSDRDCDGQPESGKRTDGQTIKRMDGRTMERTDSRTVERTDGRTVEQTDRRTVERTDGQPESGKRTDSRTVETEGTDEPNNLMVKREASTPVIKAEPEEGSKDEVRTVIQQRRSPCPSSFTPEASPLFALKKFLDFGIPRLKPNGIDGGRI